MNTFYLTTASIKSDITNARTKHKILVIPQIENLNISLLESI